MYPYEAMILVDPVMHGADPEGVEGLVKGLLEKHGAKIHDFEKWDDRKLAYEINGHKRGIYFLTHFEMPGDGVDAFRRETKITECILRQLVIRIEDDIPTFKAKMDQYYEKMKEDQEQRRGRRDDDDREERGPKSEPAPAAAE